MQAMEKKRRVEYTKCINCGGGWVGSVAAHGKWMKINLPIQTLAQIARYLIKKKYFSTLVDFSFSPLATISPSQFVSLSPVLFASYTTVLPNFGAFTMFYTKKGRHFD